MNRPKTLMDVVRARMKARPEYYGRLIRAAKKQGRFVLTAKEVKGD
jgi:hypothetical protein